MQISSASSQTLLNDSTCCVPCSTLRKALILKEDHKLLKSELGVARDSINLYVKQGLEKDSLILDQKGIITEKDTIINQKTQIINQKNGEIKDLNHNIGVYKKQRNWAIGGGSGLFILTLLILL